MNKRQIIRLVVRLCICGIFSLSVVGKLAYPDSAFYAVDRFVNNCIVSFMLFSCLIGVELALLTCIWTSTCYRFSSWVTLAMSFVFLLFHVFKPTDLPCGCVGDIAVPTWFMITVCVVLLLSAGVGVFESDE